ncbi:MAG: DUF924 domain-containing protein [SAR324 cluster bacterium]|nr:DUF924 domain-containing protein [SAR324 cluster bacterium]
MQKIESILNFWFGDLQADNQIPHEKREIWFKKSEETDQTIREQFETDLLKAIEGTEDWEKTPRGILALIILFDQFSRNMFRNTAKAFAQDPLSLRLCLDGVSAKIDEQLRPVERIFFYMPLMHSEVLENQKRCIQCFEKLLESTAPETREMIKGSLDFAHRHCEIIEKFGRFPHRNEILGRPSSREEEEFLKQPGSSF